MRNPPVGPLPLILQVKNKKLIYFVVIRHYFDVHALVGAEIQPWMRQPISSAQSVLTDVAPRGFSSDSVGRGGPGNSPSLYAAGGAHCNRLGPSR